MLSFITKIWPLPLTLWCSCIGFTYAVLPAHSQVLVTDEIKSDRCPHDLETLGGLLVKDLPNYANRVMQRSRRSLENAATMPIYVIAAGKPEFEPIALSKIQYQGSENKSPEQVFFTTLERQYVNKHRVIETQNFHWLFLTPTASGWRMVMIFSRFGSSNPEQTPSPPRDTSQGIIGQAVKLWLRDCRAGAIRDS